MYSCMCCMRMHASTQRRLIFMCHACIATFINRLETNAGGRPEVKTASLLTIMVGDTQASLASYPTVSACACPTYILRNAFKNKECARVSMDIFHESHACCATTDHHSSMFHWWLLNACAGVWKSICSQEHTYYSWSIVFDSVSYLLTGFYCELVMRQKRSSPDVSRHRSGEYSPQDLPFGVWFI